MKHLPPLTSLTELEAQAIELMFRLFDYNGTGRIPSHLARNLFREMGMDVPVHLLPPHGTLKDILLIADQKIPDPIPALPVALHSFVHMA